MASGLAALLDDVAAISKVAAASLDDVAAATGKAGAKAAGIVIDDTAVTPGYVVGFTPDRELPIIWKITLGSLRNKLLFLLPAALILSAFAPWVIMPMLIMGGFYLSFEGAEKVLEPFLHHGDHGHGDDDASSSGLTGRAFEDAKVKSAITTDFILSAEIMVMTLSTVSDEPFLLKAVVLGAVGVAITAAVYGVVALIVKADDVGLHLAKNQMPGFGSALRSFGRGLVKGMPTLLNILATVGTAAMLWVGGGIIIHGLASYGMTGPEHLIHVAAHAVSHAVPVASDFVGWLVTAAASAVLGIVAGALTIPVVSKVLSPLSGAISGLFGKKVGATH